MRYRSPVAWVPVFLWLAACGGDEEVRAFPVTCDGTGGPELPARPEAPGRPRLAYLLQGDPDLELWWVDLADGDGEPHAGQLIPERP